MRAPGFWERPVPGFRAGALMPISLIWGAIAGWRMKARGREAAVPVVCIGNFTAGGAGKTPTAIAVARILQTQGETPVFLSRGYGGSAGAVPMRVDPQRHEAALVGDEPLLLARHAPAIVARDRIAGAALAVARGASVVVMDDGLQNAALAKDVAIAVVDGASGVGNGLCMPSGPLRAPLSAQWPAVSALVVIGPGAPGDALADAATLQNVPVFRAALVPDPATAARLAGREVVAFAGIGRPEKFFETLREIGVTFHMQRSFADHAPLAEGELEKLAHAAWLADAVLVTTEKDFARIGAARWAALDVESIVLPVTLVFEDPPGFAAFLKNALGEP
jgi:tetraacyldisaccharide 4'-kinase